MSGIEVAGLVLGAFPLLVAGLRAYNNQSKTVSRIWRRKIVLHRFAVELEVQSELHRSTIENLLSDLVDQCHLEDLRSGDGWEDPRVQSALEKKLDPPSVRRAFVKLQYLIHDDIQTLTQTLHFEIESGEVKPPSMWAEIMMVLSAADLDAIRDNIIRYNRSLSDLVQASHASSNIQTKTQSKSAASVILHYSSVRKHATTLHRLIKQQLSKPTCPCPAGAMHFASLQLHAGKVEQSNSNAPPPMVPTFRVLFFIKRAMNFKPEWAWQEVDFEPASLGQEITRAQDATAATAIKEQQENITSSETRELNIDSRSWGTWWRPRNGRSTLKPSHSKGSKALSIDTSPPPTKEPSKSRATVRFAPEAVQRKESWKPLAQGDTISNLCSFITTYTLSCNPTDLRPGVLIDNADRNCNVYQLRPRNIHQTQICLQDTVSLSDVLAAHTNILHLERAVLALRLASAVMQLYKTGWLFEEWSCADVFFLKSAKDAKPVFGKPLVCKVSGASTDPAHRPRLTNRFTIENYDVTIYSLGVVLGELALGRHFDNGDLLLAHTAELIQEMGVDYNIAITQCLKGLGGYTASLEQADSQSSFYARVMKPLESCLLDMKNMQSWQMGDV